MLFDDLLFQTLHRVELIDPWRTPPATTGLRAVVCSQVAWFCISMKWRWSLPHRYEPGFAQGHSRGLGKWRYRRIGLLPDAD